MMWILVKDTLRKGRPSEKREGQAIYRFVN